MPRCTPSGGFVPVGDAITRSPHQLPPTGPAVSENPGWRPSSVRAVSLNARPGRHVDRHQPHTGGDRAAHDRAHHRGGRVDRRDGLDHKRRREVLGDRGSAPPCPLIVEHRANSSPTARPIAERGGVNQPAVDAVVDDAPAPRPAARRTARGWSSVAVAMVSARIDQSASRPAAPPVSQVERMPSMAEAVRGAVKARSRHRPVSRARPAATWSVTCAAR